MAREGQQRDSKDGRGRGGRDRDREKDSDLIDKLVHINRVAKVVKGGRRFGFAALVVVGDGNGKVGFGHGKAREVPEAIRKATDAAKRALIKIPLKMAAPCITKCVAITAPARCWCVLRRPVPASSRRPMRACSKLWAWAMSCPSRWAPPILHMVRATFDALKNQQSPRMVAARRGRSVSEILARREDQVAEASA